MERIHAQPVGHGGAEPGAEPCQLLGGHSRETAKELGIKPKAFVAWLLEKKFLYRDQKGKLLPREDKNNGLFEVKEAKNDKTQWSGVQTLITPKGRETFRLLYL